MSAVALVALGCAAAAVTAVIAWVTQPLWSEAPPAAPPDPVTIELLSRREAALADLRDIEAERAAGRLDDSTYEALRASTLASGAATLEALDRVVEGARADTERAVAAVERDVAARRGDRNVPRASSCGACGSAVAEGDRFCAACGAALGEGR